MCVWFALACKYKLTFFLEKKINMKIGFLPGSIVIIDDSNMCTAEKKINNLMRGGAKGVVLFSAHATLPKLSTETGSRIPVLAVGPKRYQQLKSHFPVRKAVAYLPRKAFDPSMLVLVGMATVTFAVGGMMSGSKTLHAIR